MFQQLFILLSILAVSRAAPVAVEREGANAYSGKLLPLLLSLCSRIPGAGGFANGGSIYAAGGYGGNRQHGDLLNGGDILNVLSGSAGDGGYAGSGSSFGGMSERADGAAAYSGATGSSQGGSIYNYGQHSDGVLNLLSDSAGDGGDSKSGSAIGGILKRDDASAYTGVGGKSDGGSVYKSSGGLLNLDILNIGSDNAGNGGDSSSGNAIGGMAGNCGADGNGGGNAYTGAGGSAQGGSVRTSSFGGLLNLNALNIGSGNAGNGGDASSGSAVGGSC